jgi:hypothetical protein
LIRLREALGEEQLNLLACAMRGQVDQFADISLVQVGAEQLHSAQVQSAIRDRAQHERESAHDTHRSNALVG